MQGTLETERCNHEECKNQLKLTKDQLSQVTEQVSCHRCHICLLFCAVSGILVIFCITLYFNIRIYTLFLNIWDCVFDSLQQTVCSWRSSKLCAAGEATTAVEGKRRAIEDDPKGEL